MVHLDRIYTKSGDDGSTGLGDGTRVPKHSLRVSALGTVDELSSVLGVVLSQGVPASVEEILRAVQNDLFDAGADLCVPGEGGDALRVTPPYVSRLEGWIDDHNERLSALNSFVLPGGSLAAAWLHLARTVCRRAERSVCELCASPAERARVNIEVLRYLNRLSDLLFVLARIANDDGAADVLWRPGGDREASEDAPPVGGE